VVEPVAPSLRGLAYLGEVSLRSSKSQRRQLLGNLGNRPRPAELATCDAAQSSRYTTIPNTKRIVSVDAISDDLFMRPWKQLYHGISSGRFTYPEKCVYQALNSLRKTGVRFQHAFRHW
jgi:hypothetical protein